MIDEDDCVERLLTEVLRDDHESLCGVANVPPAGLVWWRATMRARADAVRTVDRPIAAAQTLAVACLIALAIGAVASAWRTLPDVLVGHAVVAMLGIAVCLLVAPIAVLIAIGD
jgi:hypothetical protein